MDYHLIVLLIPQGTHHIGTTTVQVHSEDSTGNASDSSFVITVKDSTGPTITQISNQSSEVYNPIHPPLVQQIIVGLK